MNARDTAKRRDRHDIIIEILKTATDGEIKTHIMYKAKLNYAQVNEYLPMLVEKGLLQNATTKHKKSSKKVYKTTEKGMKYLRNFESAKELWSF
jgi:predicted transcriptional regulator